MSGERKKNYRMSRRVPVYFPASFRSDDQVVEGMVLQISQGGILFHSTDEIDVKSRGFFAMKVFKNEPDLVIEGEVVYRLYDRDVDTKGGLIKYGVCFMETETLKKDVIERVIRYATIRERYFKDPGAETPEES